MWWWISSVQVATYGLLHYATSAVDVPDVASAVVVSMAQAIDRGHDSTLNMKVCMRES
jgi:hypothetical protein